MGWGYYALHTCINTIKKMFRSTVLAIIISIIGIGVIFGLAGSVIGNVMEQQDSTEFSTEITEDMDEEEPEDEEKPMSPEDVAMVKTYVEAAVALFFLVMLLYGIYSGAKKGTDIFQMADVNLLFTAPVKPQSVLLFRLSFQMVASIAASLYLVFQIPNLVINMGLGTFAVIAVFAGWIFLVLFQKLMTVLSYTVFTTHEHLKKYVVPAIWIFAVILSAVFAVLFFAVDKDFYRMVQISLGSRSLRWFPIIGWLKGMVMSAVNGQMGAFFAYLLLLVLTMAVLVFFIWRIKADFYEDALSAAGKTAELMAAAKEGRMVQGKKRKESSRREGKISGWGGTVFLTKEIYNRRRTARFGFLTNTMFLYFVVTLLASLGLAQKGNQSFFMVGILLALILFFRNMGNPVEMESAHNWLFLVPDNPYKKVFFSMMAGTYNCAIDLLPAVVTAAVVFKENILIVLLWFLTLLLVDFMLSAAGLLLECIFPEGALDMVKAVFEMFLRFFLILFVVLPMAVGYFLGGQAAALLLMDVVAVVLGGISFVFYPSFLHGGRR